MATPVLIVAGALVMLAPVILAILMYLEVTLGYTEVTIH